MFAKGFSVRFADNDFRLVGYGFGESGNISFSARFISWVGSFLHLSYLAILGLQQEVRDAKGVVARMGLAFSQDAFRQVCTLNLLAQHLACEVTTPFRILVIGDGYGVLSALLHKRYPTAQIFLVDLGAVLLFQAYHLEKAYPTVSQALFDENMESEVSAFNFCPAERLETLPMNSIDLAINVASMQEMKPSITASYFSLLRRLNTQLFYCCNRLEKHLVGGEVARFMDFPWIASDVHVVDELCPWHQWMFGRGSAPHVTVLGLPVPFMHRYDGLHWHRLTKLGKE